MKIQTSMIAFVTGVAVGAAASWYFAKNKYAQLAQEEIDSVKETFESKYAVSDCQMEDGGLTEELPEEVEDIQEEMNTCVEIIEDMDYTRFSEEKPDIDTRTGLKPYVIAPEEFGEIDDYGTCSLTYYADEVLADELDEMVENIDDAVGIESLSHFGEYEDDSVFVRNDRLMCDYEILLDTRRYTDILKAKPYKEGFYDGWPTE